ncbi:MAG TPA: hypothetical protein VM095_05610 [Pyrinomonadaceae bacterium]|nr:hypothetical protein [Pyrinomonadaceae bacterium]
MNRKRVIRFSLSATSAGAALLSWSLPALAQCAMCKNAVTGSPEAAKLSESLNFAIIVLLIPPVLIFCGFFVLAYRYRKARETDPKSQPLSEPGGKSVLTKALKRKDNRKERGEAGGALA